MPIPEHVKNNPNLPFTVLPDFLVSNPDLPEITNETEAEELLSDIDQDALYDEQRSEWEVEEWDKTSPINGVDAETMISRHGVGNGPVYLIKRDGQVVYFQPHKPHVEGFQVIEDLKAEGGIHADEIAANNAAAAVLERVREKLANR